MPSSGPTILGSSITESAYCAALCSMRTRSELTFIPKPRSTLSNIGRVLKGVGETISKGASTIIGLDPSYQALLEKQIEVQQQMQQVSMYSNIEKSKHETQMAAIRNVRVG